MKQAHGFTLIELMVTIAVLAIMLTVAVPAMQNFTIRNRLAALNNDMMTSVNLARSEASKRGVTVSICKSSTMTSCGGNWSDGWIVFVNTDNDAPAAVDTGETILRVHQALPSNYTLNATTNFANYVSYRRDGTANNIGTFAVCHNSDETTARGITLTRLRPRLARDSNGDGIPETDSANITSCEAP